MTLNVTTIMAWQNNNGVILTFLIQDGETVNNLHWQTASHLLMMTQRVLF